MDSKKRTWIIAGSIIIAIVAILAWWLLFGQGENTNRNVPGGSGGGLNFFPISGVGTPGGFVPTDGENQNQETRIPALRQLSETPVAGAVAYDKLAFGGKNDVYFRWVERATGHVFETNENSLTNSRISNTTIPSIQEAIFSGDAQRVILRYIRPDNETMETALGQIKAVTTTTNEGLVYSDTRLETEFLEPGISQVAGSPDGLSFAKLSRNGSLSIASFNDIKSNVSIFTSPLSEWNLSWPTKDQIYLSTKPAPGISGYLFSVNTNTKKSKKIIENASGLVALTNPAGTRVLYSTSDGGDLDLHVLNLTTGENKLLELKGIPDKCAWSRTSDSIVYCGAPDRFYRDEYPTNWYQGLVSFTDNIWRINVDTESYNFLFDSGKESQKFDAYKLTVSPQDEFLIFSNKKDLTLWSLNLRVR